MDQLIIGDCIHEGAMFQVFRGQYQGRNVAVKLPRRDLDSRIWIHDQLVTKTAFIVENRAIEATTEIAKAVLSQEAQILGACGTDWNVTSLGLDTWSLDTKSSDAFGSTSCWGLVTEWVNGIRWDELSTEEARLVFPRALPALWDALVCHPHGDLSPRNLILHTDRCCFSIIDPGVVLRVFQPNDHIGYKDVGKAVICVDETSGLSASGGRDKLVRHACTTTPRYYPAFEPCDGVRLDDVSYYPDLDAPGNIRIEKEEEPNYPYNIRGWSDLRSENHPVLSSDMKLTESLTPLRADLLAVGIMYFEVLFDRHPLATVDGNIHLLWDRGRTSAEFHSYLRELHYYLESAGIRDLHAPHLSKAECRLAEELIWLRVRDRTQLESLCKNAIPK